jgi:hypothetical protein
MFFHTFAWLVVFAPYEYGVDVAGLQAKTGRIEFKCDGSIEVEYQLTWTKEDNDWLLDQTVQVSLLYWDRHNTRIKCEDERFFILTRKFTLGKVRSETKHILLKAPADACYFAVKLGGTKVITQKSLLRK